MRKYMRTNFFLCLMSCHKKPLEQFLKFMNFPNMFCLNCALEKCDYKKDIRDIQNATVMNWYKSP